MRRVIIFTFKNNLHIDSIKKYFSDKNVEISIVVDETDISSFKNFDLGVLWDYKFDLPDSFTKKVPFINIHPSLLPKFDVQDAIEKNFYSKDKYGGVTVHYLNNRNHFLTQESFWKNEYINLDDFTNEIYSIAERIIPRIIENILFQKINILILTDKSESEMYSVLSSSKHVNRLVLGNENDLSPEFDICLFDFNEVPNKKLIEKCLKYKVTIILVLSGDLFAQNNIYFWDGKNFLQLFDYESIEKQLTYFNKSEMKQIYINNIKFSETIKKLDSDFGEILVKIMLEKLDYTFLHWKK